ncbi:MAG: hypothetical protein ACPGEG_10630, partial [Salibacteraceae bacterium]
PLFGGIIAEKILLAIIIVGTPIAGRLLMKKVGGSALPSYLLILLVHNKLLYFGFYNFSLGILFMLLTLYAGLKTINKINAKQLLLLGLLYLLLYFSHLFFLFVTFGLHIIVILNGQSGNFLDRIKNSSKSLQNLLLVAMPSFLITPFFLTSNTSNFNHQAYGLSELYQRFIELDAFQLSFKVSEFELFDSYAQSIWAVVLIIPVVWVITSIIKRKKQKVNGWFLVSLFLLILYFIVPNSKLYMTDRLLILLLVLMSVWTSTLSVPKYVYLLIIPLVFFIQRNMQFSAMAFHHKSQVYIEKVIELKNYIPENSLVSTFNLSTDWLESGHSHNYLGINGGLIDIYNYEAVLTYFPLQYNGHPFLITQYLKEDNESGKPLIVSDGKKLSKNIDHIIVIKDKSKNQKHIEKTEFLLRRGYDLTHSNEIANLYQYNYSKK